MDDAVFMILALVRIAAGFLLCFAGYRFARFTLIAAAALEGSYYLGTAISVLLYGWVEDRSEYWVTFFVGGLVCSCIAGYHFKSGICITGFAGGVELAILIMGMFDYDGSMEVQILWMSIAGVFGAVLVYSLKKSGLVVATGFVGASLFATGITYFVWTAIMNRYNYDDEYDDLANELRSSWWTLTAVSLVVFALGTSVQLAVTARGVDHETPQLEDAGAMQYGNVETPQESKTHVQGTAIAHV
ncbi:hypothetical protein Gpo141_00013909 [Globisporangium polare]